MVSLRETRDLELAQPKSGYAVDRGRGSLGFHGVTRVLFFFYEDFFVGGMSEWTGGFDPE